MKKKFQRWYEKDKILCAFMSLLQDLAIERQCEIAIDIIMLASDFSEKDYDKFVSEIGDFDQRDYKRWYDKNPNIHLAIESLRDLTEEQRSNIIQEISNKVLNEVYGKIEEEAEIEEYE